MNEYAIIDVETNGLNSDKDEIIKLGAVKVKNRKIIGRFFSLVKPERLLTADIERLTHITNEALRYAPPINKILPDFLNFIGENTLVAHNVGYDIKFINAALKKSGKENLKNKTIDTLALAKKRCKTKKFSLCAVASFLGINYESLPDEEIVYNVYERLKVMNDLEFPETNENKFCRDEKVYIKQICRCEVVGKSGNKYAIICKIPECGEGGFEYEKNGDFIESYNKKFWLESGAVASLNRAIAKYDKEYDDIRKRHQSFRVAEWKDSKIKVYYEYSAPNEIFFNAYIEKQCVEVKTVKQLCVEKLFSIIEAYSDGKKIADNGPIENNPLYLSALENNDKVLIAELKYLYGTPDKNDLVALEGVDGIKRLPRLSKEFDKRYIVDYDANDLEILAASRYKFLHHAGVEMRGFTRSRLTVNPCEKYVIDAAKTDEPPITFDEFLKLFD